MLRAIARLFSVAPGEERKTALLYSLHLVFYLGLMWGDAARESLFLSAWKADDLALVFVAYAVLGFVIGLAYTFVAGRVSNGRLLKIIMGVMVVWLLSVRLMLETHGGPRGAVYPYFYLAYSAFRDLATLHILIYINDFYDTRAAKRALPLMLSAGIAGGMLAGFTAPLLTGLFGLDNAPLMWIAALAGCFLLIAVVERRLPNDVEQIERRRKQARSKKRSEPGGLDNLRQGFEFVRRSGLLRTLSVATFAMVILMNLLHFQSSIVFADLFPDRDDLFAFYSVVNGVSSAIGLAIQSLLLSRLVNWLGVGTMNLAFPLLTLGAVAAINAAPGMLTGIFARLNFNMFKQTFRNPLDAMLYNSVPITQKARSRGFVNGVVVPLGTLFAGLIVLAVRMEAFTLPLLAWIGLGIALLYLLAVFTVRREYARSMASLLAGDELALFQQDISELGLNDPATVKWLRQRLESLPLDSNADGQAVFVSQMLYDMEAGSLPFILSLAEKRSVFYRKGIIEFLEQAGVAQIDFIRLCQRSLKDPETAVREAAAAALLSYLHRDISDRSAILPEEEILNSLFQQLNELPLEEQALLLILLFRRGSPGQKAKAHSLLEGWLSNSNFETKRSEAGDSPVLEAGLLVLAEIEQQEELVGSPGGITQAERFKALVSRMLSHPDPYIRHQAISALVQQSRRYEWNGERRVVQFLLRLLDDPEEGIRLAVIEELQPYAAEVPFQPIFRKALNDPSLEVRKAVCSLLPRLERAETGLLWKALHENAFREQPNLAESAVYLLRRVNEERAGAVFHRAADSILHDAYRLALHGISVKALVGGGAEFPALPGAHLMANALREDALLAAGRLLWLLSASTGEEEIQAVRRALLSSDSVERANAVEALEAGLPPSLARPLRCLLDNSPDTTLAEIAAREIELSPPSALQTLQTFWQPLHPEPGSSALPPRLEKMYADGWLTAAAIHLLKEVHARGGLESKLSVSVDAVRAALESTLQTDPRPNVCEIAAQFLGQIESSAKELPMSSEQPLTLIEKVIFLKEIPFFADLPFREISILAGISEEVSYPAGHRIFAEGETTKSLYLIVRGRVSVQQQKGRADSIVRLATLGAKNFFAETSLFDGAPHQADVVTIEPVDILLIRQSALFTLVRRKPDLGLSLLKSLSQRLRETYAQVAQSERAKSQTLVSLFDKLEG
jgi:CRP-like cAMP-binding protein/HEAT repeat protein